MCTGRAVACRGDVFSQRRAEGRNAEVAGMHSHTAGSRVFLVLLALPALTSCGKSIHSAASSGDVGKIRSLLARGADVNALDERGWTPLGYAAKSGQEEAARVLLASGADPNAGRISPLCLAAGHAHVAVVDLLLEKGADARVGDPRNGGPLNVVLEGPYKGPEVALIVKALLSHGADQESRSMGHITPIMQAAYMRHVEAVVALLRAGARVDATDDAGRTCLHCAAEGGNATIVSLLLAHGADPSAKTRDGETPLALAAKNGRDATAETLLTHSADPNSKDLDGSTPLGLAIKYGGESGGAKTVEILLAHGADPNIKDKDGWTPLGVAIIYGREAGRERIVEMLLTHGADPNTKGKFGETPLSLADEKGYTAVVKLLKEHGAKE